MQKLEFLEQKVINNKEVAVEVSQNKKDVPSTVLAFVSLYGASVANKLATDGTDKVFGTKGYEDDVNKVIKEGVKNNKGVSNTEEGKYPHNPNFPSSPYDGSVPKTPAEVIAKLKLWLQGILAFKRNTNLIFGLLDYLQNIEKAFPPNSPEGKLLQAQINKLLQISGPNGSFAELIVIALRDSTYFGSKPEDCQEKTRAALQKLIAQLQGTQNQFLQEILKKAIFYSTDKQLQAFFDAYPPTKDGKLPYTPEQSWIRIQGNFAKLFTANNTAQNINREMLITLIDELIRKYAKNGNLLIQLIMQTMGQSMAENQQSFGAYGALSKSLSELSKIQSDIESLYAKGFMKKGADGKDIPDPEAAKAFIAKIKELIFITNEQKAIFGDTLPQQVVKLLEDIGNIKIDANTSIKDILNGKEPPTMDQWTRIAKALQDNKTPTKDGSSLDTNIINGLKTIDTAISSQSSTIQTAQGRLTSMINNLVAALKDLVQTKYYDTWIKTLVQNQRVVG